MKYLQIFLITLIFPFVANAQITQVTSTESQELLSADYILVDVREETELLEIAYHSEGMMHIPLSELSARYEELPKDKNLIIACRSGGRSQKAIKQLEGFGFDKLSNLKGGILDWQAKGFPVVLDGVAPAKKSCHSKASTGKSCKKDGESAGKACCSKKSDGKSCKKEGESSGKACCSSKSAGKATGKSCSKEGETSGKACCSKKKT